MLATWPLYILVILPRMILAYYTYSVGRYTIIHVSIYSLEEHGGVGHAGLLLGAEGGGHGPARGGLHAQPVVLLAPGRY